MDNAGNVLTIDDLSEHLKIPKASLYKLVKQGKVPGNKVGRHWRFAKGNIDRWMQEFGGIGGDGEVSESTTNGTIEHKLRHPIESPCELPDSPAALPIPDGVLMGEIDSRDYSIILELQKDARQSDAQIARTLDLSENTIRKRISRLISEGIVRISAATDPAKVGYFVEARIAIRADLSKIGKILQQLAAMHSVSFLAVTTGRYNILISVTFRSPGDLFHFLTVDVSGVTGIFRADTSLVLETRKRRYDILQDWHPEIPSPRDTQSLGMPRSSATSQVNIDNLDHDIIVELQRDARQTDATIARTLKFNEGTVRRRINRLIENNVIVIAPIIQPGKVGYSFPAHIGIQVDPKMLDYVLDRLTVMPRVHFVASTAGEFDILIWATFRSPWELYDFTKKDLSLVPGVKRSETLVNIEVTKMEWGILEPRPGTPFVSAH